MRTWLPRWFKRLMDESSGAARPRPYPIDPLLCLLPLGFIFDTTGYLPPSLRLFVIYGLLALPLCLAANRRSAWGAMALVAIALTIAALKVPLVAELFLLLLAHQVVWASAGRVPRRLTRGILAYALIHIMLFLSPLGYPVSEWLAAQGCRAAGWITGSHYHIGYTYQNMAGFLLFVCLSVFGWDRSWISKTRTLFFVLIALLINSLLAAVLLRYIDFGADFSWELKYREPFRYPELFAHLRGLALLLFPALIFVLHMLAYLFLHYDKQDPTALAVTQTPSLASHATARSLSVAGLVVAAVAVFLATPPTAGRQPATTRVIFVNRGVVSFTRPTYGRYGRAAGGMYGMLPDYVRMLGCEAIVEPDIPEKLRPNETLVLTNLDEPLEAEIHRRIWEFVAAGGNLWVLGDHTFIKNGRNHINDLLAPCHIRLKHDSAQFFPQGWFHSYRFRQGTAFGGLRDLAENRPAILVGASLDLEAPAQPFVLGRFGYSDWGTTESDDKRGYIGDFDYQPHERLGDLVLVAGERYGLGKVLVYGDTTSFFNNNLSRSYELLRSTLSWFGERPGWLLSGSRSVRILAAGVLLAALLLLAFNQSTAVMVTGLAVLALFSIVGHRSTGWLPLDREYGRAHVAVIDYSHQPYASKHSSMDSALHGVSINLMRYGLLPLSINDWEDEVLQSAALVVLNAPRRPFGRSQRKRLETFMRRGGTVVLACGHPHADACRSLLDSVQIGVRGLPLGRFFDRPAFGRPISFLSAWPLLIENPGATVLCAYDDWPLIASVPVGRGRMVIIGDSEFLHNRNLEGHENHDPANIQFIKALLEYALGERAP